LRGFWDTRYKGRQLFDQISYDPIVKGTLTEYY